MYLFPLFLGAVVRMIVEQLINSGPKDSMIILLRKWSVFFSLFYVSKASSICCGKMIKLFTHFYCCLGLHILPVSINPKTVKTNERLVVVLTSLKKILNHYDVSEISTINVHGDVIATKCVDQNVHSASLCTATQRQTIH